MNSKNKKGSKMDQKNQLPERPGVNDKGAGLRWHPDAIITRVTMPTRGKYPRGYPRGAVVHYTAGRPMATLDWGAKQGYAYLLINANGELRQGHPIDEWGYHAGPSAFTGLIGGVSDDLIGIEVSCAGKVTEVTTKSGEKRYKAWFHKSESEFFKQDEVRYSDGEANIHKGWYHRYTEAQEDALISLLQWLKNNDPLGRFSYDLVLGHDEVCSPWGRKVDPGASLSMTMPEFRAHLKKLG